MESKDKVFKWIHRTVQNTILNFLTIVKLELIVDLVEENDK